LKQYCQALSHLKPGEIRRKEVRFWAEKPDSPDLLQNEQSHQTKFLDANIANLV